MFSGHQNSSFYVKSYVSPDGRYLLSGSSCGNAFIWQVRKKVILFSCVYYAIFTTPRLFTCIFSHFMDLGCHGHFSSLLCANPTPTPCSYFICEPPSLSLQIDRPEVAPLMLTGRTKEVTAVAWCPSDMTKIATCSDDSDLRLWRVAHGKKGPGEIIGRCQQYMGYGKDACMYF